LERALTTPNDADWVRDAMRRNLGVSLLLERDGRIVEAVGACEALLGRDAAALAGAMLPELAVERERTGLSQVLAALDEGNSVEFALIPAEAEPAERSHWRASRREDGRIVASGIDPGERSAQVGAILKMTDALPLLVAYVDRDLRYRFNNTAYEQTFGIPRMVLFGKRVAEVIAADTWERIEPRMRRALAGERVRFNREIQFGNGRLMQARIEYIPDRSRSGEVKGFYAIVDDVTEYASAIAMMRAVHEAIHRARLDYDTTIENLLRLGCEFLDLDIGIVSDTRNGAYTVRSVVPEDVGLQSGDVFAIGETYCDVTLRAEDVVATTAAGSDPRIKGHPCYDQFGLESYIGVPLVDRGKVIGTLNFSSPHERAQPFSELELELVRLLGSATERLWIQDQFEQGLFRSRLAMERRALTDSLTDAPNRAHIFAEFEKMVAYREAEGSTASIALLDVDHFKRINDEYGHQAGDTVLVRVAETIRGALRDGDLAGRVGGEEFLILLPGSGREAAACAVERVRGAIEALQPRSREGRPIPVTASVGVAECGPGLGVDDVYSLADRALYRAKSAGRNRVELAPAQQ
jgi:diguanylate cyclase (GGDEF)-like protein/PAS domain S-box-containing protein